MGNSVNGTPGSIATGDVKAADVLIIICKTRLLRKERKQRGSQRDWDRKTDRFEETYWSESKG